MMTSSPAEKRGDADDPITTASVLLSERISPGSEALRAGSCPRSRTVEDDAAGAEEVVIDEGAGRTKAEIGPM